jgi:hypothetical protein
VYDEEIITTELTKKMNDAYKILGIKETLIKYESGIVRWNFECVFNNI